VVAVVRQVVANRRIPGLALAVTSRDGLLYSYNTGYGTIDPAIPVTLETQWLWFSMSKVVTATATMRLADDGRLDLDAPFAEYLSLAPRHKLSGASPRATVRQLLTHTAGIANPAPIRWVRCADDDPADATLFDRLLSKAMRPVHAPGSRAAYTNVGYLVLGQVVENVAGEPFRRYVERNVLIPAGMASTSYSYSDSSPAATGYIRLPRVMDPFLRAILPDRIVDRRQGGQLALRPFLVDGAAYGGLVGPVTDAARFAQLHLRDGELDGTRVISADAARTMRELKWDSKARQHGIGWFRGTTGQEHRPPYVEHFGAGAGFWNAIRLYPEEGLGMAVMANTTLPYDVDSLFETVRRVGWTTLAPRHDSRP
jgi:CubicO group peptidase (beta-lactamase class C family)